MKKWNILITILLFTVCISANAQNKVEKRMAYILKEMKFDKATQGKIKPFIQAYLMDLKTNKDNHDNMKEKYKKLEESDKLNNTQADELINSKFNKDEKDLKIRRQYYARFKEVVGAAKARKIIGLSNDKVK